MKELLTGKTVERRDFLKFSLAAGAAAALAPSILAEKAEAPKPEVWVIHGKDKEKMMEKCLEIIKSQGGFGKNVKTLALKVNAAWAREPEVGANTDPVLVSSFLAGVKKMGINDIFIPENSCASPKESFPRSGIKEAVEANGFEMIDLKTKGDHYRKVTIPGGESLKEADVAKYFLDADAVVNMPVAKHHGGSKLSMAMKNWMGAVRDRGYWHRNSLHQCIADFAGFMKPTWTIIDATKTMMDKGPQGPSKKMKYPDLLIFSKNQVAADAWASTLFHRLPEEVLYIKLAAQKGLGPLSVEDMIVHKIEV